MMKRVILTILALCPLFLATSCSKRYSDLPAFSSFPIFDSYNYSVGRFKTSYLADQIHAYYGGFTNNPIGIATFVDLDNLYNSSSFGRFYGEQLMTELSMRGYNVIELRKADVVQIMTNQGEFGLSREIEALKGFQDLSALIVGTYVVSPQRVYVNARLIEPRTARVLSAGSVEMKKTKEIARLLRTNSLPPSMERIPVKNLGYSSPLPPFNPWLSPSVHGVYMERFDQDAMGNEEEGGNHHKNQMNGGDVDGAHPEAILAPST